MFTVFVQNQPGSTTKHRHIDKTQKLLGTEEVSRPYPFAYGFVLDTTSGDGDNLDCYVMSTQVFRTGETVQCEAVALLEQIEDGQEDHNILAVPVGEEPVLNRGVEQDLREFIAHVFDHVPCKEITTGQLLGAKEAKKLLTRWSD